LPTGGGGAAAGDTGISRAAAEAGVEHSFVQVGRYRRLTQDYVAPVEAKEATVLAAFGITILRRRAKLKAS
jgi:hypothetical protein